MTSWQIGQTRNGRAISVTSTSVRRDCILPSSSIFIRNAVASHRLHLPQRSLLSRFASKPLLGNGQRAANTCSQDHQKVLREHGLQPSISAKGNCYDNASVETFFKIIKAELIWRRT